MSTRGRRPTSGVNASNLERQTAVQGVFGDINARIRAIENGRGNGPGSSFGMPFGMVDTPTGDEWQFSIDAATGTMMVTNVATGDVFHLPGPPDQSWSYPGSITTVTVMPAPIYTAARAALVAEFVVSAQTASDVDTLITFHNGGSAQGLVFAAGSTSQTYAAGGIGMVTAGARLWPDLVMASAPASPGSDLAVTVRFT